LWLCKTEKKSGGRSAAKSTNNKMDKYRQVEKKKPDNEIKENEIRITTQGKMRNFISYATTLFKEKGATEVLLKAMGRAINKTVTIAEIIKRRIVGLHQITVIDSTDITDVWEPLEEGLDRLETTRHVSSITIVLSTQPLDESAPGYQAPLPADQVKELAFPPKGRRNGGRGRGRARGGKTPATPAFSEEEEEAAPATRGRNNFNRSRGRRGGFRGRGRGRGGFRGRGRRGRGGRGRGGQQQTPPRLRGQEGEQNEEQEWVLDSTATDHSDQ